MTAQIEDMGNGDAGLDKSNNASSLNQSSHLEREVSGHRSDHATSLSHHSNMAPPISSYSPTQEKPSQ